MNFVWKKYQGSIIFIILFILICLVYQYHLILFLRPQGFHQWRQTIGLSFAKNYYAHGMNFFYPETHNLLADGNKTGFVAAECPWLYYLFAALWKIFGIAEWLPRLISLLLVFSGLFSFYKVAEKRLNAFWAIVLPLFFFTSPVMAYYSISFLPDSSAFGLALMSFYCIDNYLFTRKNKWLYLFLFLTLCVGLLKTTSCMIFVSVFIIFILENLRKISFRNESKIFKPTAITWLLFSVILALIAGWYVWAAHYNDIHGVRISDSRILPIWDLSSDDIFKVIRDVYEINWYQLFCSQTTFLFLCMMLTMFFLRKKVNRFLWMLSILLMCGIVLYILLWFAVWGRHDYYMFPIILSIIPVSIAFFDFLKNNFPSALESKTLKIVVSVFLLYNIWYCSNNVRMRHGISVGDLVLTSTSLEKGFWDWYAWDHNEKMKAYETLESYNRSIGIKPEDLVISIPDESVCITLYLMNQRGWNEFGNLLDEQKIIEKISLGAKYLFVRDSTLLSQPTIQPFLKNKIGQHKNVIVYDLRSFAK